MRRSFLGTVSVVAVLTASAQVELGAPFADGAVLQRGMKVPVWGKVTPAPGNPVRGRGGGRRLASGEDRELPSGEERAGPDVSDRIHRREPDHPEERQGRRAGEGAFHGVAAHGEHPLQRGLTAARGVRNCSRPRTCIVTKLTECHFRDDMLLRRMMVFAIIYGREKRHVCRKGI